MKNKEKYKRNLPHIQPLDQIFFVTWNLKGAIPKSKILQLKNEYKKNIENITDKSKISIEGKRYFKNHDNELHNLSGCQHFLKNNKLAKNVADTLHY